MFNFKSGSASREQLCNYITEALSDLPIDILQMIYRVIACHESGLE